MSYHEDGTGGWFEERISPWGNSITTPIPSTMANLLQTLAERPDVPDSQHVRQLEGKKMIDLYNHGGRRIPKKAAHA